MDTTMLRRAVLLVVRTCGSECFLQCHVKSVRALLAPPIVEAQFDSRTFVEQHARAGPCPYDKRLEQFLTWRIAVNRCRIQKCDHANETTRYDGGAILDFAVEEVRATISALAIAACGA